MLLHVSLVSIVAAKCGYEACHPTKEGVINVHMVPHSHDDTGWKKTVDQYYYGSNNTIQGGGIQYTIDTVVTELLKNSDRKFVFVEIAFFAKWWAEATDHQQQQTRHLVETGQLEFLLGGWCMNDEAASHYTAMLEQNGLGLQWLRHHFGECGRPRGAWQIDPFGHSKTQAELFALMGYDSVFFARMDYQEYNQRSKDRAIEMIWRGNDDFPQSRDLFTGGLVDTSYGPPGGFWFEGFSVDPIIDNEESDEYNLPQRLDDFIKQIQHYQDQTHPGNIMFTMGSDFAYYNSIMYFKNMDKIIYHMNRLHGDKYNVIYSTPACYTKARNEAQQQWTVKSDDFMPYSNGPQGQYWSGYFTSRPGFKGYVWDTNPVLQMCHHMNLRGAHVLGHHGDIAEHKLAAAFGVGQHHDGISGTEQEHVTSDYTRQLHRGRTACRNITNQVLEQEFQAPLNSVNCEYRNVSICAETEAAKEFTVGVYSPASHAFHYHIRVPVNGSNYEVTNQAGEKVPFDVVPVSDNTKSIRRNRGYATNELWITAKTEGFDFATFNVKEAEGNEVVLPSPKDSNMIENEYYKISFGERGLETINGMAIRNDLLYFNSSQGYGQNSGAYIFRPNKTDPFTINAKPTVEITKGSSVEFATVTWGSWASQEKCDFSLYVRIENEF